MAKLLIEVDGGCIVNVSSDTELEVFIVDWDNLESGGCPICGAYDIKDGVCEEHGSEEEMTEFVDEYSEGLTIYHA